MDPFGENDLVEINNKIFYNKLSSAEDPLWIS